MNFQTRSSLRTCKEMFLLGCREHVLEDAKPESITDTADLALPPEMPILIDFHALKDILGPPLYELEVKILITVFTWMLTRYRASGIVVSEAEVLS